MYHAPPPGGVHAFEALITRETLAVHMKMIFFFFFLFLFSVVPAENKRLFVGKRNIRAVLHTLDQRRKPRDTHHRNQNDVRAACRARFYKRADTKPNVHTLWHLFFKLCVTADARKPNVLRAKFLGKRDKLPAVPVRSKRSYSKQIRIFFNNVERLSAYRAGSAKYRNFLHIISL
jgi:hypothetical protein